MEDTIVAISTATGGGIGIVRLSGKQAIAIADEIFLARKKIKPSQFRNFTAHYGHVVEPEGNEIIDEVLLIVMRAPKSYTCEDIVEISCHGGALVLKKILALALDRGARLAEPGEFTKRAFLNGRIDLTQAEAVLDIIRSKTETFLRMSTSQLKGELTTQLETIRAELMNIYTGFEAILNFPEDDIDAKGRKTFADSIAGIQRQVKILLQSGEQGKIFREGIKIVICGRANVGKSSLLNVLLKQPRAIVSDIAGTTRDTIEEAAQIRGIPFQLVDTAGILEPRDLIEEEAVKRSHLSIQGADLVLFVLDGSQEISREDISLFEKVRNQNLLIIINKSDLPAQLDSAQVKSVFPIDKIVSISALRQSAIPELEESILENVLHGRPVNREGVQLSNVRHIHSLKNCAAALDKIRAILVGNEPLELASEQVRTAVHELDNITGRNIDSDLLDKIFSEFCIGK